MSSFRSRQISLWKEFLPLSLSDLVMAICDPFVTMALAHLPSSQATIGAYGIAKSSAVFFESPIIMILHASNVLGKNKDSRKALWRFTLILSAFLAACLFFMSLPFVFESIARVLFGIEGELAQKTRITLSLLAPWPFFIGWRRFFQGLLIQVGCSKQIGRASLGRIGIVGTILLIGFYNHWSGEVLAALALIGGIFTETLFVTIIALRKNVLEIVTVAPSSSNSPKTMIEVARFYWPLVNSSLVVWAGRAILLAVIARASDGPIALASWTAGWGLVLVLANATRMVQQVIIRRRNVLANGDLLFFASSTGLLCSAILVSMCFSSVSEKLLVLFLGKNEDMIAHVFPVLVFCSLIPLFVALQNALQGFLIGNGQTKTINFASYCSFVLLLGTSWCLVRLGIPGAKAASLGMLCSYAVELSILGFAIRPILKTEVLSFAS